MQHELATGGMRMRGDISRRKVAWGGFCPGGAPVTSPSIRVINPDPWPARGAGSGDGTVALDLNGDGTPGISGGVRCDVPEDGQCDYYLDPVPPAGTVMCVADGPPRDGVQSWTCGTLDSEGVLTGKTTCTRPA
jgi:hypothetical protein